MADDRLERLSGALTRALASSLDTLPSPDRVALAAELFWSLDDDAQTRFFVHVAELADAHQAVTQRSLAWSQWAAIGSHLRECACSTFGARQMIEGVYGAMQP